VTPPDSRPEQPWQARPDLAGPALKPTADIPSGIFLLMGVMFLGIPAPALIHIPQELHRGNYPVLIVLIFPGVACFLLGTYLKQWRAHRRFGNCELTLARNPIPLAGQLAGTVSTGHRFQPEHGVHLKLTCLCQRTTGSGKNRSVHLDVLWQDEQVLRPEAVQAGPEPDRTRIPVTFQLPEGQPETSAPSSGADGIHWRLEVKTRLSGPDLNLTFELPVYQVAGFIPPAKPARPMADSLVGAGQMPIEDLRRDDGSRIRVTDGPGGREFYFPALRNPLMALIQTVAAVVFGGFPCLLLKRSPADWGFTTIFVVVFGGFGLLLAVAAFNSWFRGSRVVIDSSGLRRTYSWFWLLRWSSAATPSEVERIEVKAGTTSGSTVYWALKAIRTNGKSFTLATDLIEKPEAEWLAREMNRALGR
jgi:hypothetical protein